MKLNGKLAHNDRRREKSPSNLTRKTDRETGWESECRYLLFLLCVTLLIRMQQTHTILFSMTLVCFQLCIANSNDKLSLLVLCHWLCPISRQNYRYKLVDTHKPKVNTNTGASMTDIETTGKLSTSSTKLTPFNVRYEKSLCNLCGIIYGSLL